MIIASSLALVASLAARERQAGAPKPVDSAATDSGSMSELPMSSEMKHGKGAGTMTAIDPAKRTVTLDHGDITELNWPPMKIGLAIKPEVLTGIKVGDTMSFEIDWDGKAGPVTRIPKSRS